MASCANPLYSETTPIPKADKQGAEENLEQSVTKNTPQAFYKYEGLHRYAIRWGPLKVGKAELEIRKEGNKYNVRFDTWASDLGRIFSDFKHASLHTTAVYNGKEFVPLKYRADSYYKDHELHDFFIFHENGMIMRNIKDSNEPMTLYADRNTKVPLTVILNALINDIEKQKDFSDLGHIIAYRENKLLILGGIFHEKEKAYEIFFTKEMLPGGGPLKFFYNNDNVDASSFEMIYGGSKLTFKRKSYQSY